MAPKSKWEFNIDITCYFQCLHPLCKEKKTYMHTYSARGTETTKSGICRMNKFQILAFFIFVR